MELERCPFCGGDECKVLLIGGHYKALCPSCKTSSGLCNTEAEAITAWNRRNVNQCKWTCTDSGNNCYEPACCDEAWEFNEGGPKDNKMKSCCFCGGELIESEVKDE